MEINNQLKIFKIIRIVNIMSHIVICCIISVVVPLTGLGRLITTRHFITDIFGGVAMVALAMPAFYIAEPDFEPWLEAE